MLEHLQHKSTQVGSTIRSDAGRHGAVRFLTHKYRVDHSHASKLCNNSLVTMRCTAGLNALTHTDINWCLTSEGILTHSHPLTACTFVYQNTNSFSTSLLTHSLCGVVRLINEAGSSGVVGSPLKWPHMNLVLRVTLQ